MNFKKSFISMLAIAAVVVACEEITPTPDDPTQDPIENPEPEPEPEVTEDGTEAKPYLVKTADDLAAMRSKVTPGSEVWFRLENDIDMTGVTNWVPVNYGDTEGEGETAVTYFDRKIHFDGNNKTISNFAPTSWMDGLNICSYPSLFGVLYGTCKDLNVTNANLNLEVGEAGILAGSIGKSGMPATVTNVSVQGTVVSTLNRVGGFAGCAHGATITNCSADVEVTASSSDAAGFVGYVEGTNVFTGCNVKVALISKAIEKARCGGFIGWNRATETTIENCHVLEGSSIVDQSTGRDAAKMVALGGFIGFGDSDAEPTKLTVKNSSAKISVNSQDWAQVNSCFIASLGYNPEVLLENCTVEGDVIAGPNPQNYAGGLIARAQMAGINGEIAGKVTIKGCSYKGNITGRAGVGGLIGAIDKGEMTITDTHVQANVKNYQNNVAGILGLCTATVKIDGCSFDGKVDGVSYVGGVIGGTGNSPKYEVTRTSVKGEIIASNSYSGGIIAAAQAPDQKVENCFCSASVELTGTGKQIGCIVGTATSVITITNCYASGDQKSNNIAGGIVGRIAGEGSKVSKCIAWNSAISSKTNSLTGAIIGSLEKGGEYTSCVRKSDMTVTGTTVALVDQDDITTLSASTAYHGKAAAAGKTASAIAKELGWDEAIWDLSKDVPALK